jgi:hypothetical protein
MVYFLTKNIWAHFGGPWNGKCCAFYGYFGWPWKMLKMLVYFMAI